MQQRQRLKNLDRFKNAVGKCETGLSGDGAILVCTDVAARGLDIPYVNKVLHYQCPFNAELYIHRCGRTARIGREGEVLALLAPEDEKSFRAIRRVVLGSSEERIEPYPISYVQLSKLEPLVEAAKQFEAALHRTDADKKQANWLLKAAKDADLTIDDNLTAQINETLGGKLALQRNKNKKGSERTAAIDMVDEEESGARHKQKELSKVQQLKKKYEELKSNENYKRFSNSSYLTPEAASYLNEMMKAGQQKADMEIVYAGQHSENVPQPKFKRTEKYASRYKKRRRR